MFNVQGLIEASSDQTTLCLLNASHAMYNFLVVEM
jgi:hypothetical protein